MTQSLAPKLRPLSRSDIPDHNLTARGWVVELDGEIVATCGVMYSFPPLAFSRIEPKLKKYPKVIVRVGKMIRKICLESSVAIFAVPDDEEPTARKFLEHLGFRAVGDKLFQFVGD